MTRTTALPRSLPRDEPRLAALEHVLVCRFPKNSVNEPLNATTSTIRLGHHSSKTAVSPPSTKRAVPVTNAASSEAR